MKSEQHSLDVMLNLTQSQHEMTELNGQVIAELVIHGVEDVRLDRTERLPGSVLIPVSALERIGNHIHGQNQMIQFLGIALNGVLPYAENHVLQMGQQEAAKVAVNPALHKEAVARYDAARVKVHRAQIASETLEQSTLFVDYLSPDAFDDRFQVRFDPDEEVPAPSCAGGHVTGWGKIGAVCPVCDTQVLQR